MPELRTEDFDEQELFSTGQHNGDKYSVADLDAMVDAFGKVGFKVPLKLGHSDTQKILDGEELPAIGWVENLRRSGNKLFGDFKKVPGKLADLIRAGGYRAKSAEIYWSATFNGQKFPRALKAVSLLGMSVPAVSSLNDIISLYADNADAYSYDEDGQEFRVYEESDYEKYPWDQCIADQMKKGFSKERASKICGAIKAKNAGLDDLSGLMDIRLSVDDMRAICPDCADRMVSKNLSALKFAWDEETGTYAMPGGMEPNAMKALCEKFGAAEGFRTRCMEHMAGKVDNEGAFCNALKQSCGKMSDGQESKTTVTKTNKSGGKGMDENEVQKKFEEMFAARETELKKNIRSEVEKEFEYKVHKAREDGKAEVVKEKEVLEEEVRKLQSDKRSERIEHWIKTMKTDGKLLPVEESKVRAMREWIADDGPELKYFTLKNGKTEETRMSPADLFESLFSSRPTIFKTMSTDDQGGEDDVKTFANAGAEVDHKAKTLIRQQAEKNTAVTYSDAIKQVLSKDGALAQRYNQERH